MFLAGIEIEHWLEMGYRGCLTFSGGIKMRHWRAIV